MTTIYENKETLSNIYPIKIGLFTFSLPFIAALDQSRPFSYAHGIYLVSWLFPLLLFYMGSIIAEKSIVNIAIDDETQVLTLTIRSRFKKLYAIAFNPENLTFKQTVIGGHKPMTRIWLKDGCQSFEISRRRGLTNRDVNNVLYVLEHHYANNYSRKN